MAGAVAGVALTLFWPTAPRWVGVPLYLLLGWVAVWFAKTIVHKAGWAATILLAVGGVLYSIGAVFYALRWPDPWPRTFGYHKYFTPAPRSRHSATTSPSGSWSSRPVDGLSVCSALSLCLAT